MHLAYVDADMACYLLGSMQWLGSFGSEYSDSRPAASLYSDQEILPRVGCGCIHSGIN